jgi:hypothetical protein
LRNGHVHVVHFLCYGVKLPNLKLKTRPKQLLGSLLLDITLPNLIEFMEASSEKVNMVKIQLKKIEVNSLSVLTFYNYNITNAFGS